MERSKYFVGKLMLALLLISQLTLQSAYSTNKKAIYTAYINKDMNKWIAVIQDIETKSPPKTIDQKLELISYYYGYTAFIIGMKKYDEAEKLIAKANLIINEVIKYSPKNATALSYKGSFIGYKIGVSKFKAIYLGQESLNNVENALEIDPQNIQANIDRGNIYYYSPKLFGGNKAEALKFYIKAIKLIETQKATDYNWLYLNLLTNTALAFEKTNELIQAKHIYEKILKKEPTFQWVKNDLYPKLLRKLQ